MQAIDSFKFWRLSIALFAILPLSLACTRRAATTSKNTNLAFAKSYVSSDPTTSPEWKNNLTDGSWRNGYRTIFATGTSAAFPKTVTIDLETPTPLGYVAVGVPPFGSTKTIRVSLSEDGKAFKEVGKYTFSLKKDEKHLFSFADTFVRFVRLTYVDHYDQKVGYPITQAFTSEVMVYAPGAAPILPPALGPESPLIAEPKYDEEGKVQKEFMELHESFLKRRKEGSIDLLMLGDSIIQNWQTDGKDVWERYFSKYSSANFGIGGDRIQHVLWRMNHGELDGINPKVLVLLVGTNNIQNSVEDVIKGDAKIVSEIHRRLPKTKVLLLGIFPRGTDATKAWRKKIKEINVGLAKLDDGHKTRYLDFGDKFLEPDGHILQDMMPDAIHPTAKGYQIWAVAMQPLLDEMMKD